MSKKLCCGRPVNLHGWDAQVKGIPPRRRYRCPVCGDVTVENMTRCPNGARGQVYTDERGRARVYLGRDHPLTNSGGWQYVYRVLIAEAIDRELRPDEHAHHINGDHTDDRLDNLLLVTAWFHGWLTASAVVLAEKKGPYHRFIELENPGDPFPWPRYGPILGNAAK